MLCTMFWPWRFALWFWRGPLLQRRRKYCSHQFPKCALCLASVSDGRYFWRVSKCLFLCSWTGFSHSLGPAATAFWNQAKLQMHLDQLERRVSYCYLLHGKLSKRIAERRKKKQTGIRKTKMRNSYFYDQAVPRGRQAFPQAPINTRSTGCCRASGLPSLFLISIKCNSNFPINKRFLQAKETGGNTWHKTDPNMFQST